MVVKNIKQCNKLSRILFVLLVFSVSLVLSGCDRSVFLYSSYDHDEAYIIQIQLIQYQDEGYLDGNKNGEFLIDNLEVLEELDNDEIESLLFELEVFSTVGPKNDNSFTPNGLGLLLKYNDDYFKIITLNEEEELFFSGLYDSNFNCVYYIGVYWSEPVGPFMDIIDNYFKHTI